jgi:hypothetical protein
MQKLRLASILCLLLMTFTASAQSRSSHYASIEGVVLEQGTNVPVEFAVVVLSPSQLHTTTNKEGRFEFKQVDPGPSVLTIQFLGKETIEEELDVVAGKTYKVSYEMVSANFRLEEVTVTATQNKAGQATASNISRQAMDHLQTSSIADIMALLPGGSIVNPTLSSSKTLNLRSSFDGIGSTATSYGSEMNSLGTSIIIDGAPVSNNANWQVLAPSISGGTAGTTSGVDIRGLSTDNIESIEVIRGIPSVEYGDLTTGAVIVKSRAGKAPLSIRVKANPQMYQASVSKGFSLGEKAGNLNLSGDYAYNTTRLYEAYSYYQRFNLKGLWTKRFGENFNTNTVLDLQYRKDTREQNPDDQRSQYSTSGEDKGIRLNSYGTYNVQKGWFQSFNYSVSFNYADKKNTVSQLLTNAEALHSTCTVDGAIVSNEFGKDIYDIDGNKITNIPAGVSDAYVTMLPYTYFSTYDILGKELNGYAKLTANFNKRWENINNHILLGVDYKVDGNLGEGKVYDEEFPPYRSASGTNASYRKRAYKDVPFIHQVGVFVQDAYKHAFGQNELYVTAGTRFDYINGKTVFTPRFNGAISFLSETVTLRGGWGITAKAPTAVYLYPEKAYFNYNNYYYDGTGDIVSTIRVFDPTNPDLEIAKNRKAEVGVDLKLFNKYRLSVTAYDELMKNGYTLGSSIETYQLIEYTRYNAVRNEEGNFVPQLDRTYNIFSSYATPQNNAYAHNRGLEFDLDLGRFNAIRTAFTISGAYMKSVYKNQGHHFRTNSDGNKLEKHIGIHEKGLYTRCKDRLISTIRITHNIPQIGFVVTLATQINWLEKFWTEYGDDTMFTQYISYKDGKVHDFDPAWRNDPEYAYMFPSLSDTRFIAEQYFPTVTFNINISKEIGDILTASFFANNMFNNRPLYESKANPGSFTELLTDNVLFFGFDIKINIK